MPFVTVGRERIQPLSGSTTRMTGPVLDLRGVVLAGFAMGTGEVTRYLAVHGTGRVSAAVLVAPLLPFLLKTDDNPEGIGRSVFHGIAARIAADRPAVMKDFLDRSYNVDLLGGSRVSDQGNARLHRPPGPGLAGRHSQARPRQFEVNRRAARRL